MPPHDVSDDVELSRGQIISASCLLADLVTEASRCKKSVTSGPRAGMVVSGGCIPSSPFADAKPAVRYWDEDIHGLSTSYIGLAVIKFVRACRVFVSVASISAAHPRPHNWLTPQTPLPLCFNPISCLPLCPCLARDFARSPLMKRE